MSSDKKTHDTLFKYIIIGDSDVGKSCLLRYFLEKRCVKKGSQTQHTIGVEFGSKIVEVNGHKVKLQIWDTAGQERFRSVTRSYYRGSIGCLLVYDITSRDSYNNLISWLGDARSLGKPDITVCVVGNKIDRESEREVTLLEASRFCQENELLFIETSAFSGEGVEALFLKTTSCILKKIADGVISDSSLNANVHDQCPLIENQDYKGSWSCCS